MTRPPTSSPTAAPTVGTLDWKLSEEEQHWISRNDDEFKFHLDRYKYPNRYEDIDEVEDHHKRRQ